MQYKNMTNGTLEKDQRYIKLLRAKLNKAKRENGHIDGINRLTKKLATLTS